VTAVRAELSTPPVPQLLRVFDTCFPAYSVATFDALRHGCFELCAKVHSYVCSAPNAAPGCFLSSGIAFD